MHSPFTNNLCTTTRLPVDAPSGSSFQNRSEHSARVLATLAEPCGQLADAEAALEQAWTPDVWSLIPCFLRREIVERTRRTPTAWRVRLNGNGLQMLRAPERANLVLYFIRVIREANNIFPCTLHPFHEDLAEGAAIGMRDIVFPNYGYCGFQVQVEALSAEVKRTAVAAEIRADVALDSALQQLVSISSHHLGASNLATVSSARADLPSLVPLFFQDWLLTAIPGSWEQGSPAWEAAWRHGMQPTFVKVDRPRLMVECPFGCKKKLVLQAIKPGKHTSPNFENLNRHFVRKHSRQFIAQLISLDTHRAMKTVAPHVTDVALAEAYIAGNGINEILNH